MARNKKGQVFILKYLPSKRRGEGKLIQRIGAIPVKAALSHSDKPGGTPRHPESISIR